MKLLVRLSLAIAAVVWLAAVALVASTPSEAQGVGCRQNAIYDAATNGSTRLVQAATGRRIFICGYTLFAGGTASVSLVTGTGTTCGTGEAALTPAFPLVAQKDLVDGSPVSRGLVVGPGLDLCIKTSAGVAVQAIVYFSQE